ncbi:hypothetical protein DPMN_128168 [Dreissena polymorpha]|uniref:Uncharacterized protein n=1 Tax=Dreissena polymorpha TaxID=45954 RepID=A0A9D4H0M1_DREPO|nr:hypothetical protein DPMN_128168 [Dreissena polymorpha]
MTPEDSYPPPQRVDEPNVVYRSKMEMSDKVLDSIFSKGSKYHRNEDGDERMPYFVSKNEPRSGKTGLNARVCSVLQISLFSPLMFMNISIKIFRRNISYPLVFCKSIV